MKDINEAALSELTCSLWHREHTEVGQREPQQSSVQILSKAMVLDPQVPNIAQIMLGTSQVPRATLNLEDEIVVKATSLGGAHRFLSPLFKLTAL